MWLVDHLRSPVGELRLATREDGVLVWLSFHDDEAPPDGEHVGVRDPHGVTSRLERYFAGELAALDELACAGAGTPFQQAVWRALRDIPAGQTRSYGQVAAAIGAPRAVRAVGAANGRNPIAIVVPCHRVIGADGTLTGYGGGLPRKRWLLAHEARHLAAGPLFAARRG
jgi:methylated-DNA-[protein]-cysteine S-methyltransferase